tara:strand:+ start:5131 stop:6480 length:1350 start_codon:yes stop_codon:yes gene_type:complete
MNYLNQEDTICAIATGGNMSAIAIIRISGNKAIKITNSIFNKDISNVKTHTIQYGNIINNKNVIDEVLISIYKKNKSFTGEESVEISCHGSLYIQNKIIQLLIEKGCRIANPGEFSMRAFKNGKIDLSQAESIEDLISSQSKKAHEIALKQLRGGFSNKLKNLRNQLIDFASLIELELDFSEEDVEFANKEQFENLVKLIKKELHLLIESFKLGNVIKNGISVAIIGAPNVGKSTLLNCLLNEEKAIVSEIAGTTRDIIEDKLNIEGFTFRFIDTAGIRKTSDTIENIGIKKTLDKAKNSHVILYLIEATSDIENQLKRLNKKSKEKTIIVVNKIDLKPKIKNNYKNVIFISAKNKVGIDSLKESLLNFVNMKNLSDNDNIITNLRHYNELKLTLKEINEIIKGLDNEMTGDFLSINIRQALFHLGSITGEVTTDDLLGNIFSKFCIGK